MMYHQNQAKNVRWPISMSLWGLALAVILSLTASGNASTDFYDGAFNLADWQTTVELVGNGGTITPIQLISGGNPGYLLELDHTIQPAPSSPPGYSAVYSFNIRSGAMYDPSLDGAVMSMDFAIDFLNLNTYNQGVAYFAALKQNGNIYGDTRMITGTGAGWQSNVRPGLLENEFGLLDENDYFLTDYSQNPDFSAAGSSIEFGFCTAVANDSANHTIIENVGFDNWSVTVHPVPEPTTFAILALGGLFLNKRRK